MLHAHNSGTDVGRYVAYEMKTLRPASDKTNGSLTLLMVELINVRGRKVGGRYMPPEDNEIAMPLDLTQMSLCLCLCNQYI